MKQVVMRKCPLCGRAVVKPLEIENVVTKQVTVKRYRCEACREHFTNPSHRLEGEDAVILTGEHGGRTYDLGEERTYRQS